MKAPPSPLPRSSRFRASVRPSSREESQFSGKKVGDTVEFGGLLGSAPVIPVHPFSSAPFIQRGGRIPAPMQSLKN